MTQGMDHHRDHQVTGAVPQPQYAVTGSAALQAAPLPEPSRFARLVAGLYERSPRWAGPVAIAACFAGVAGTVWVVDPTDSDATAVPTCLVKLSTGLDCPGCGGTRALYYLLQGDVPDAARHHAPAVFAAPFLVWLYIAWSVRHVWGKQLPVPTITIRAVGWYIAVWGVFAVLRNLPFAPFTGLYV